MPARAIPGEPFGSSTEPCMGGGAQVTCSEDADDDSDSDSDGDDDEVEQEGEHQDGDVAHVEGPVAVPQHSLGSLGCDDDEDEEDDD